MRSSDSGKKQNFFWRHFNGIAMAAIVLIPTIYTTLFLGSMWDPYGNVDQLPVAVVNNDKSVDYEGKTLAVGDELVDKLKENDQLDFHFVSADKAEKGIADGTYYMVITIPSDFSENASTLMDDEPKKMELQYATNPGTNYIASKMSETALAKIQKEVSESVTKEYTETIFDQMGTVGDGMCNVSLGTSGTVFISSSKFGVDSHNALHAFAHADGHYHLMGCMLSAASCNKWWMDEIIRTKEYTKEQENITKLGENNVFFLPYLMGERSPHNNPDARGTFIGLTMDTTREDMTQAVLEGVAFAIRDSFEVAKSLGIQIERTKICGGGAKSPLWRRMIANVLNIKVDRIESEEGPALGGAMLAAVACGVFSSVEEAAEKIVRVTETIEPEPELVEKYERQYQKFAKIYPTVKDLFTELL